jgi:uncharacterized protein YcfJ
MSTDKEYVEDTLYVLLKERMKELDSLKVSVKVENKVFIVGISNLLYYEETSKAIGYNIFYKINGETKSFENHESYIIALISDKEKDEFEEKYLESNNEIIEILNNYYINK